MVNASQARPNFLYMYTDIWLVFLCRCLSCAYYVKHLVGSTCFPMDHPSSSLTTLNLTGTMFLKLIQIGLIVGLKLKKKKKKEKKMSSNTVKLLWPSIKVFGFSNGLEILYIGALHPYLSIPHLSHDWWAVLLC